VKKELTVDQLVTLRDTAWENWCKTSHRRPFFSKEQKAWTAAWAKWFEADRKQYNSKGELK
jgi:hypothetical protein